jgi:branched-chain amino acid transport system permease protein
MKALDRKWVWIWGALLLVILLILPFLFKNYRVFQFNLVLVYAIAILGLNVLTGFNGQFSLGHGAFYAFGAYTAAILMDKLGVPYWATLPAAFVFCFGFGILMGFPALRLAGHFLALATFALALAVPQLLKYKHIEHLTGGVQGIVLTKPEPPFSSASWINPSARTAGSTTSPWRWRR